MADVEEVRIGGRQRFGPGPSSLCSDAVGHTDRASGPVVVAGPQPPCLSADSGIDQSGLEQAELGEIQSGLLFVGSNNPYQMVQDLGHADGGERGGSCAEEASHFAGRGLSSQVGDHGVGVQDRQRTRDLAASYCRASRRARSLLGPSSRYLPSRSLMGLSGSGRMTTLSPRSTTMTRRVFQRARTSAGMDTWPFREMVISWLVAVIRPLYTLALPLYDETTGQPTTTSGARSQRRTGPLPKATTKLVRAAAALPR
jgi:hypothetical protein